MSDSTDIENFDYLQIVNSNFGDLVSHYINMWQAYNQSFTVAAMNLCLWGGLAWVSILTLKAPADKLKTAASAIGVVLLVAMLLQPGNYKIGPAGGSVGLSAGAGWSVSIIGNIYQLFKSALDNVNKETAMSLAFENAYHVTNEGTLKKFANSPVKDMYQDYIDKCQGALSATAGSTPDTRLVGQSVGLYDSTMINPVEVSQLSKEQYEEMEAGNKVGSASPMNVLGLGLSINSWRRYFADSEVADKVDAGRTALLNIPEDQNPFRGNNVKPGGYLLPSKEYWVRQYFPSKANEGASEFDKTTDNADSSMYSNPQLTEGSSVAAGQEVRFYPKNCLQMYGMVTKAVQNWTDAIREEVPMAQRSSYMRDQTEAQTLMIKNINNMIEQRDKFSDSSLPIIGSERRNGQDMNWGISDAADSIMTKIQDVGKAFKEWMLTFKVPAMINGCAMLAGMMVVLFPVICVFAVFVNPSILISFVKILSFAFMIPFVNNLCLTMAATLLAMNGELMTGLTSGNIYENYPLLISAGSAQYIIFMALTAVEIVIAKMLIWDDVKGLSGFNPAGAASGMAATGGAVIGAAVKLGSAALSLVGGPAKLAGALGRVVSGAGSAANGAAGATTGAYRATNIVQSLPKASAGSASQASKRLAKPSSPPPKPNLPALPPPTPPGPDTPKGPNKP